MECPFDVDMVGAREMLLLTERVHFISYHRTRNATRVGPERVTSVKIPSLRLKRDVSIKRRCRNFFSLLCARTGRVRLVLEILLTPIHLSHLSGVPCRAAWVRIYERRECPLVSLLKAFNLSDVDAFQCALADRAIWGRMRSRMRAELLKWKEKQRRVSERWMWRTSKTERKKPDRKSRNHIFSTTNNNNWVIIGCWERRVGAFAQRFRVKWKRSKNYHLTVWSDFRLISVTKEFISNNRLIKVECNFKLLALLIFTLISLRRTLRSAEVPTITYSSTQTHQTTHTGSALLCVVKSPTALRCGYGMEAIPDE